MSFISDAFGGAEKPKVEPQVTRDTAADAVAAEDERKRKLGGYGAGTMMLSGTGGVASELTGTRSAGG